MSNSQAKNQTSPTPIGRQGGLEVDPEREEAQGIMCSGTPPRQLHERRNPLPLPTYSPIRGVRSTYWRGRRRKAGTSRSSTDIC